MIFLPVFLTFINLHSVVKYFQKVLIIDAVCRRDPRVMTWAAG